ncbi:MAG TPA: hypothetical protein VIP10_06455 [Burkholderiaceae bacterium]
MNTPRTVRTAALSLAAALTCGLAVAAGPSTPASADVQARYEQERARCLAGQSGQVMDACLKEAVNAREAAKKGQLADGGGELRKNAKERCDVLTGAEQRDCVTRARVQEGSMTKIDASGSSKSVTTTTSGSVKGGGILRETVTRETTVGPAVPAASAPK